MFKKKNPQKNSSQVSPKTTDEWNTQEC